MAFSKQQFEVALTCEFAFLQSCVDIEPLHDALVQLDAVQAVLHNYASAWKLQNVFLGSMGLRLEHSLATELVSIRLKLNQLGFPQNIDTSLNLTLSNLNHNDQLRMKRGAFDFVSEAGRYMFGFVSASQYKDLIDQIKENYLIVQERESKMFADVSLNRDHLNLALSTLDTFKHDFQRFTKGFKQSFFQIEQFLGISIQISYTLSSIQALLATLQVVRTNADHLYPARYILPRDKLKAYILHLSDTLSDVSPIFNTADVDNYYRYRIATTTSHNNKICQLVKIPLINNNGKYIISHAGVCPPGRVCLSNSLGSTQVSVTDFTSCLGVHFADLPSLCNARACLAVDDITCFMVNYTFAIIATPVEFQITLNCKRKTMHKLIGISALIVPTDCSIDSQKLKIGQVHLMKTRILRSRIINLPYIFDGEELHVNDTGLGGPPIFDNTEISNLVLPKLKMVINNTKLLHHTKHNFIISTSASVVCGLLVLALVCSLTLKCYRKLLKPICCLRKETDNLKPTCSRKHSDDADCDSENRHECLDPIDARNK